MTQKELSGSFFHPVHFGQNIDPRMCDLKKKLKEKTGCFTVTKIKGFFSILMTQTILSRCVVTVLCSCFLWH